eukprot:TRINITY_DN6238_c0_g3_i2.p1 TRINITY_DN6238_c0_g3~~TRINITY_DN6238_c0_g3_i2.p1  ORF type:complete len:675 (+),score=169.38 TRINITY_DN6238_c0_g3_i2:105-2129(+)
MARLVRVFWLGPLLTGGLLIAGGWSANLLHGSAPSPPPDPVEGAPQQQRSHPPEPVRAAVPALTSAPSAAGARDGAALAQGAARHPPPKATPSPTAAGHQLQAAGRPPAGGAAPSAPQQHAGRGKDRSQKGTAKHSKPLLPKPKVFSGVKLEAGEKRADCPLPQRHPFTMHRTMHGNLAVFPSAQGRVARSAAQYESWWCSQWSDRGCGFSHAYTKQPPPGEGYNLSYTIGHPPHDVGSLPHGAGGVPAAFDDWKTLVVGGSPAHPSAKMLSAITAHPGSFVQESHKLLGPFRPSVRRGDATAGCARTLERALLWPHYVDAWAERNFAHFLGDVWHWLFQLVDRYSGGSAAQVGLLPVVFFPANSSERVSTFPRATGLPDVVRAAAPGLTAAGALGAGRTCVRELIVDCPAPNVFRPYGAFQRHLALTRQWSFAPRPPEHPGSPLMVLLLRRPGGSRVLQNPQQVSDIARSKGWCVQALRSDRTPLPRLISALQNADSLAAAHGAELAMMTFLRNASIVIEVVPELYADGDGYYVEQARAGGLTLLRWRLITRALKYWGKKVKCNETGHLAPFGGRCWCLVPYSSKSVRPWGVFRHRGTTGFVEFPAESWAEVVRVATDSLPFRPKSSTCPSPPQAVERDTGVADVMDSATLQKFMHGLLCNDTILKYPAWTQA